MCHSKHAENDFYYVHILVVQIIVILVVQMIVILVVQIIVILVVEIIVILVVQIIVILVVQIIVIATENVKKKQILYISYKMTNKVQLCRIIYFSLVP